MDGKSLHVEGRSMDFYVLNDPTDTGPIGFVAVTTIAEAPGWGIAMTFHHNATANTIDLVGVQMFDSTKPAPIGHPRQQGWGTSDGSAPVRSGAHQGRKGLFFGPVAP